jgi:hypothetical protein
LKKAGIILIGLALTIFVTGHFFIFQISQNSHKNQFRSYMLQNLDQTIKVDITPSELYSSSEKIKWIDGNKEVIIDGQLYDVLGSKNSGKTVSLFLINDAKEKDLINNYEQLANSLHNTSSSGSELIKDFLSLKYLQDPLIEIVQQFTVLTSEYTDYIPNLSSVFISLENPPPLF